MKRSQFLMHERKLFLAVSAKQFEMHNSSSVSLKGLRETHLLQKLVWEIFNKTYDTLFIHRLNLTFI